MTTVARNRIVSIRYIMKNGMGDVIENTMKADPVSYLHGSAGIQSLLQAQLEGLIRGDKKTVRLPASSGLTTEDYTFDVIIDEISLATEEEVMLGYPVKPTVQKCESDCDCYDNNR